MAGINCWRPQQDAESGESRWCGQATPDYLRRTGGLWMLDLPHGYRGTVNGLPIVGGVQVVGPGDLVRVTDPARREKEFSLGRGGSTIVAANDRTCRFCGVPIVGDGLECKCGAVFCAGVGDTVGNCPECGEALSPEEQPSEQLL